MSSEFPSSSPVAKTKPPFRRAVVIGGSVAGLTAAKVLSDHFEQVTLVERSPLADGVEFSKGVPQARHPHILLLRGEQILEEYFPGFREDLLAGGGNRLNFGSDLDMRFPDGWLPHYETKLEAVAASRRLLDYTIYQRVAENRNIRFKANSEVMAICSDEHNRRAIGVQIRNRENGRIEDIPAELVVDASGRSSKAPQWLSQLGFTPPEEQTVNALPGYATRIYDIPEGFDQNWKTLYIMPNPPEVTRGAIILPMEGNRWHLSLIGMSGDYPPTDEAGFMEFARSLVSPKIYEAIKEATAVSPIWGYRDAANRLRRYDQMDRYLEGFVAMGDAVYALESCLRTRE